MSEKTNELQSNGATMDSTEFEAKLTELFTQHKESKLKLVPRILEEFKGNEKAVLEHLHNKYVLGIVSEKPKKKHHKVEEGHSGTEAVAETKPKKSKKKLIIIIAAIVVLGGLGAVGFMMKDKLFGKHDAAKTEGAATENAPAAEQPKQEAVPTAEAKTDSTAKTENAEKVAPDSAKKE